MNVNLPILLFSLLANLLLGLFVYHRNPKSATNGLFFLLSLDIAVWSVTNYLALTTSNLLTALYITRIVMALAVPQAILFYLLVVTIPGNTIPLPKWALAGISIAGTVAVIACVSPYVFTSIIFVHGAPSPTPGPAMPVFVLVAVGSLIAGIVSLLRRMRHVVGLPRTQLQIIGVGVVLMFGLIFLFNFVFVVVFSVSDYVSASPLYTLPFVGATAYAIIKHRFLDMRLVIARAVSYTVLITLFALLYALLFALTSSLLVSPLIDPKFVGISTAAALLMLLTFPAVKQGIEKVTDAVFYKGKYDTSAVLYKVSQILGRTLRLEEVAHQLLTSINAEFQTERACVILIHEGKVYSLFTDGYEKPPEIPEHTASYISALGRIRVLDDEKDPQIRSFFADLDTTLIIPLATSQRSIGELCVGTKLSGEPFSTEDIHTLEIIASEAAVAIENSLSYEEIRRFNITLEDEVKTATNELRRANEKLLELDKLKDEFVSLASHELRTPLTSIRSYLWMALSGKGGELGEKQRYYLERSYKSADRLIRLVNDMLNISRIESGRMAVQFARVDIGRLISEVVSEVQPKVDELGVALSVDAYNEGIDVIADTDKVKEVLINFIGNALKFTPRGGSIRIRVTHEGEYIRVSVTDSGIGFDVADADKLFKKFSTLGQQAAKTQEFQSTGLGLFISKSIITMHGGSVRAVSSGIGKGATFSFTLPTYSAELRERMQRKYTQEGLGIIHSAVT